MTNVLAHNTGSSGGNPIQPNKEAIFVTIALDAEPIQEDK